MKNNKKVDAEPLHVQKIKCRSQKQKEFLKVLEEHEVTFAIGPAGTSKTYTACYHALKCLEKGQVEKIILIKPNIEVPGYELGFLPGEVGSKIDPYMQSFYDNIDKIVGEDWRKRLINEGLIQTIPIAFLRGRTLESSYCIIDEAQNCNIEAFKTIITRIGQGSIFTILGDCSQIDFKKKQESVLEQIVNLFKDSEYIGSFEFDETDVVRHPIIVHILKKLKEIK